MKYSVSEPWYPEQSKKALPVLLLFGIIYSLISLVNHALFRTYALDLGMFNQALHSITHFKKALFTLGLEGYEISFWGTHFSPIVYLYIPFHLLFGSYGLLVIQILAILFGGTGILRYSYLVLKKFSLSLIIMTIFFGMWGIYSALSFDFHNNVIGSMMVPWFFYYLKKSNVKATILFFILALISQENIALFMVFILAGLIVKDLAGGDHKINPRQFIFRLILLLISTGYFLIVIMVIIPHFNNQTEFFFRYASLGSNLPEIAASIISDPLSAVKIFLNGRSGIGVPANIKLEFHLMVLISGGILLLFRPYYLIMLIPLYAQKMLSSDPVLWGINMQYSIEFAPILSLCIADSAGSLWFPKKHTFTFLIIILLLVYSSTAKTMISRNSVWYNKANTVFWQKSHFKSDNDIRQAREAIRMIPDGEPVSASSRLAPHLYKREKLYHFPVVKDASYILILKGKAGTYPLDETSLAEAIDSLKNSGTFINKAESEELILLKRK